AEGARGPHSPRPPPAGQWGAPPAPAAPGPRSRAAARRFHAPRYHAAAGRPTRPAKLNVRSRVTDRKPSFIDGATDTRSPRSTHAQCHAERKRGEAAMESKHPAGDEDRRKSATFPPWLPSSFNVADRK